MTMHDPALEYPRRQRLLRRTIFVLAAVQLGYLVSYFTGLLSVGASAVGMIVLVIGGILVFTVGVRWVQPAQPRVEVSPEQAVAVAHARTSFVRRHGTLGFGLLWGTGMAAKNSWDAASDHTLAGLMTPAVLRSLAGDLVVWLPVGLLTGYLWGRIMWRLFAPRTHTRAE